MKKQVSIFLLLVWAGVTLFIYLNRILRFNDGELWVILCAATISIFIYIKKHLE